MKISKKIFKTAKETISFIIARILIIFFAILEIS